MQSKNNSLRVILQDCLADPDDYVFPASPETDYYIRVNASDTENQYSTQPGSLSRILRTGEIKVAVDTRAGGLSEAFQKIIKKYCYVCNASKIKCIKNWRSVQHLFNRGSSFNH